MIVLARKATQKIVIGDNIILEVVKVAGNRVIIGVVAPRDVPVVRGELKTDGETDDDEPRRSY